MSETAKTRHAFTLVELMVVIGVIAVLISLLLPALNRAREAANAIKCQSNMRQMGIAINLYAVDYGGVLPRGYNQIFNGTADLGNRWYLLLANKYLPGQGQVTSSGDTLIKSDPAGCLFICPDDTFAQQQPTIQSNCWFLDYFANGRLLLCGGLDTDKPYSVRLSRLTSASDRLLLAEKMSGYLAIYERASTVPGFVLTDYLNTIAYRHGNRDHLNVLFADSHVESWSQSQMNASLVNIQGSPTITWQGPP